MALLYSNAIVSIQIKIVMFLGLTHCLTLSKDCTSKYTIGMFSNAVELKTFDAAFTALV